MKQKINKYKWLIIGQVMLIGFIFSFETNFNCLVAISSSAPLKCVVEGYNEEFSPGIDLYCKCKDLDYIITVENNDSDINIGDTVDVFHYKSPIFPLFCMKSYAKEISNSGRKTIYVLLGLAILFHLAAIYHHEK